MKERKKDKPDLLDPFYEFNSLISLLRKYELYEDAAKANANATGGVPANVKASGSLSFTNGVYNGTINADLYKYLVIKATDNAGNVTRSANVHLRTDTDLPTITSKYCLKP